MGLERGKEGEEREEEKLREMVNEGRGELEKGIKREK